MITARSGMFTDAGIARGAEYAMLDKRCAALPADGATLILGTNKERTQ